jgi:hypothetical protein
MELASGYSKNIASVPATSHSAVKLAGESLWLEVDLLIPLNLAMHPLRVKP